MMILLRKVFGALLMVAAVGCAASGFLFAWGMSDGWAQSVHYSFFEHLSPFTQILFGAAWWEYWQYPVVAVPGFLIGLALFRHARFKTNEP